MSYDGTLKFDTKIDEEGLQSGLDRLGKSASTALGVLAGNLMTQATNALINLGKEALNAGTSLESGMAKVSTLFTGSEEELGALKEEIRGLSTASGLAADGLAEAAYSALSASVPAEQLGAILEKSTKLAAAGFTDVDTALSATAKTMNAYGQTGEEAMDKIQKVLIQTQNKGITTVGELGASLAQVTPTAASFGVAFEQVGASLAVMTAQGTPTAQATTQLNALIAELGKNGTVAAKNLTKAAEGSKYAGMSFKQMMNSGATLDEVLGLMQAEADRTGVSMVDMFSSIEAGKGALAIFSQSGATFREDLEAMTTDLDVVGEAYGKVSDTVEFKSEQIKTGFSNVASSLYDLASGPIKNLQDVAIDALGSIQAGLSENGLAGIGDAVADMLQNLAASVQGFDYVGLGQSILDGIKSALTDGSALSIMGEAATGIIFGLMNGLGAMAPSLFESVTLILSDVAETIITSGGDFLQAGFLLIQNLAIGLIDNTPLLLDSIATLIPLAVQTLLETGASFYDAASQVLGRIVEAVPVIVEQLKEKIPEIINGITSALHENGPELFAKAQEYFGQLLEAIPVIIEGLVELLPTVLQAILDFFTASAPELLSAAGQLLMQIIMAIPDIVRALWNALPDILKALVDFLIGAAPALADAAAQLFVELIKALAVASVELAGLLGGMIADLLRVLGELGIQLAEWLGDLLTAIPRAILDFIPNVLEAGKAIVTGLWDGIKGAWGDLKEGFGNLTGGLLDKAKNALGIHSPSRKFRDEVGAEIPPGIAEGVDDGMPDTLKDLDRQADELVDRMRGAVSADLGDVNAKVTATGNVSAIPVTTGPQEPPKFEQTNNYYVPVVSPSEAARTQREALRAYTGGVQ